MPEDADFQEGVDESRAVVVASWVVGCPRHPAGCFPFWIFRALEGFPYTTKLKTSAMFLLGSGLRFL